MEFKIIAEQDQQVFFQPHHQGMNPGIEDDVGALEPHLRRVAHGEILYMDGHRDHRTRNAEALGDMPLHLRAQHQLGLQLGDGGFDLEIIVRDERFEAIQLGRLAHVAGVFASIGAEAADSEPQFARGNAGGRDGMGGVAEDVDALAGQVGKIDRFGVPG